MKRRSCWTILVGLAAELIFVREDLIGSGTATITLARSENSPRWSVTRARYQFAQDLNAVPEPATMFLVGAGLAAASARRWRKTSQ
jgi:PEP-CTERM motif-containing protein